MNQLSDEQLLSLPLRDAVKNNMVLQVLAAKDRKVEAVKQLNEKYVRKDNEGKDIKSIALHGTTSKVR